MKPQIQKIIYFLFGIFLFLGNTTPLYAENQDSKKNNEEEIKIENQEIQSPIEIKDGSITMSSGDFYKSGGNITISKKIPQDLTLLFGGKAEVNTDIAEDLLAIGKDLFIDAKVGDDIHAISQKILINEGVGDNIILLGKSIEIKSKTPILGDAWAFTGGDKNYSSFFDTINTGWNLLSAISGQEIELNEKIILDTPVQGNIFLSGKNIEINAAVQKGAILHGESITINGSINGNVTMKAKKLIFGEEGEIRGHLKYIGSEYPNKEKIGGKIEFQKQTSWEEDENHITRKLGQLFSPISLSFFLSTLLLGALLIAFAKNYFAEFGKGCRKNFFSNLGVGFLGAFGMPIFGALLALTIIGIPATGIILFAWSILLIISWILSGLVVGSVIISIKKDSGFLRIFTAFFLGSILLFLLGFGLVSALGENTGNIIELILKFFIIIAAIGGITKNHFLLAKMMREEKKI